MVARLRALELPGQPAVRKIAASLAAGCSIIIKCPEETPGSPIGLVKCFHDAGLPAGVLNLVYGVPAEISEYLIPHPVIRKISLHRLGAGRQAPQCAGGDPMKRATMELGGHSPVHRLRRCRRGGRREDDGRLQVPQRRAGVHLAYPLLRAREGLRHLRRPVRRDGQEDSRSATAWRPTSRIGPLANHAPHRRHREFRDRRAGAAAPRSRPAASASATRATSTSPRC